jgi:O-antigen/teichoic acid export membrane protein
VVAFGGYSALGAYEVARRVVTQVSGMSATIFTPLLPVISTLNVYKKREELSNVVRKSLSYLGMVSIPIVLFIFLFCVPLMRAWLNMADVSSITLSTRMLLVGSSIDLFTGPLTVASVGMGTAKIAVLKLVSPLILYVVLPPALGSIFGFSGVLIGEIVALSVGAIVGIRLFEKWAGISTLGATMRTMWRVTILIIPIAIIIWFLWHFSRGWMGWERISIWGGTFLLYLITVLFVYRIMGLISRQEVNYVRLAFGLGGKD